MVTMWKELRPEKPPADGIIGQTKDVIEQLDILEDSIEYLERYIRDLSDRLLIVRFSEPTTGASGKGAVIPSLSPLGTRLMGINQVLQSINYELVVIARELQI